MYYSVLKNFHEISWSLQTGLRKQLLLLYLKELYSNAGEHELEQRGNDDNVADGPDGHKHTLHYMLQNTPKM